MCIWEFGIALRRWGLFAGDKMQITRVDGLLDHLNLYTLTFPWGFETGIGLSPIAMKRRGSRG